MIDEELLLLFAASMRKRLLEMDKYCSTEADKPHSVESKAMFLLYGGMYKSIADIINSSMNDAISSAGNGGVSSLGTSTPNQAP